MKITIKLTILFLTILITMFMIASKKSHAHTQEKPQLLAPIIDNLSAGQTTIEPGGIVQVKVNASDPDCSDYCYNGCGQAIYSGLTHWVGTGGYFTTIDNGETSSPYEATAEWQAPLVEGIYTIEVRLTDNGAIMCGGRQHTQGNIDIQVSSSTAIQVNSFTGDRGIDYILLYLLLGLLAISLLTVVIMLLSWKRKYGNMRNTNTGIRK